MKIIFKTKAEVLREVESDNLSDDLQDELDNRFDGMEIEEYSLTFTPGTKVADTHNIKNIREEMLQAITITVNPEIL
jgi:hypothetical protein